MKEEENRIQEYFNRMKQLDDENLSTPSFELPKSATKSKKLYYVVPATIAASLALLFLLKTDEVPINDLEEEGVITITIETTEDTYDFLANESSISDWNSPTHILIQEFED